jgi:protein TonB
LGDREGFRITKALSVLTLAVLAAALLAGAALFLKQTPEPPPPPTPPPAGPPAIIGTTLVRMEPIHKVKPQYPPKARAAGIRGYVMMEARIDKNGTITSLKVLEGHPLLNEAALEAVRQWRYRPTIIYGQTIEAITTITVNFDDVW